MREACPIIDQYTDEGLRMNPTMEEESSMASQGFYRSDSDYSKGRNSQSSAKLGFLHWNACLPWVSLYVFSLHGAVDRTTYALQHPQSGTSLRQWLHGPSLDTQ